MVAPTGMTTDPNPLVAHYATAVRTSPVVRQDDRRIPPRCRRSVLRRIGGHWDSRLRRIAAMSTHRIVAAGLALLLAIALAGCNTMEGAGEDVEDAGEAMQNAAD